VLEERSLLDAEWMRDAVCAKPHYDGDDWFPNGKDAAEATRRAKRVCTECLVQAACLAYAIAEDIAEGVWGGATPAERRELVKSGRVTAELVAHWGPHAMLGREFMRDREYDALRWAEIMQGAS
jgi:hypothetical protein